MKRVFFEKRNPQVDMPFLFLIVLILFLVSIGVLVGGALNLKKGKISSIQEERAESPRQKDEPLDQYFNKEFSQSTPGKVDEFLKDDPFKEICKDGLADDLPSVSSHTVCYR